MTEYYYTKNPHVRHRLRRIDLSILGLDLQFVTDNGVFSKSTVDYGSRVILNQVRITNLPAGAILDLGCGYGPIGIALAKRWPQRKFIMTDVNNLALELARRNAQLNHVKNVEILSSDVYDRIDCRLAGIVTNPPIRAGKRVVTAILTGAVRYLLPGGRLTAVVRRKQGEPSAKKMMQRTFGNCQILKRDKGYYVLESFNRG